MPCFKPSNCPKRDLHLPFEIHICGVYPNMIDRYLCQTGALLLDGGSIQYFGATVPINLVVVVLAELILVRGAEYYGSINKSLLGSVSWSNHLVESCFVSYLLVCCSCIRCDDG